MVPLCVSLSILPSNPCARDPTARCDFKLIGSMTSKRWYPTLHVMCPITNVVPPRVSLPILPPSPCAGGPTARCDFKLIGSMTSKRWYPTAQLLPDGRVIIVGGANTFGNIVINTVAANNPTYEYWPRAPGEGERGQRNKRLHLF